MWLAQFVCAPQFFKTPKGLCGHTVYNVVFWMNRTKSSTNLHEIHPTIYISWTKLLKMFSNSSVTKMAADWSAMILRHCSVQGSRLLVHTAVRTWCTLYVSSSLLLCDNYILTTMSADERFVTVDSTNLPEVDVFIIGEYLNENDC
jgi:hypothetical protein